MGLFKVAIKGLMLLIGMVVSLLTLYWYSYTGLVGVVAGWTGILVVDVQRKRKLENQSFGAALHHYLTVSSLSWLGFFMRRKLEKSTKNIQKVQEETLLKQVKINAETEYGKRYDFSAIHSVEEFINAHPLTRYSHFEPYIDRMVKGETNVLTADQPIIFGVTSGTSGKSNILPMVKRQAMLFLTDGVAVLYNCMTEAFPESRYLQKNLKLFYNPKWRESASGIKIGPNSSTPARSKSLLHIYTTPKIAYDVLSEPEALYLHLLFALKEKKLGMLEANFSSLIFNSFRTMEDKWNLLVDDIEKGRINPDLNIEEHICKELNSLMKPDPERASELRDAYKEGIVGLGRRIWPDASVVIGADTGTFEFYGTKLRETYLKGIPLYSPIYAASEGLLGVNVWPKQHPSRYLLVPTSQFFEFIPVDRAEEPQPATLLMHQVEAGQEYELAITNLSCVYRYRFGDVVKVTGFYNQCPIIEFKYRQGQFLNVRGEKTSESSFYSALSETVPCWSDVRLTDYCCAESIHVDDAGILSSIVGSTPCYHVFLEVEPSKSGGAATVTNTDRNKIDETLSSQSYVYFSFRKKGSIGPMKVHLVRPGSFADLRHFMIQNTTASSVQYKVPRVLKKKEAVKFMMDRVIS
ncbi:GH3 domain-containing protein-like [Haliotis cracherodii]|uniref:GH3 domain-containing protein-like n=1 Tax=Haliotis cracherodii TaxID=6455 RepID=UPI0039EBDDBB